MRKIVWKRDYDTRQFFVYRCRSGNETIGLFASDTAQNRETAQRVKPCTVLSPPPPPPPLPPRPIYVKILVRTLKSRPWVIDSSPSVTPESHARYHAWGKKTANISGESNGWPFCRNHCCCLSAVKLSFPGRSESCGGKKRTGRQLAICVR